jgi:hypothetical protein
MSLNPVTFDELNTLKGINTQTTIQAQLDSKDTDSLTTNYILVGDAGGLSASVPMSGGATIVSSGLVTLGTNTSYATTATAAGSTTLVAASAALQYFTGSTTQTVVLPVVSTLALGWKVRIVNNSSGALTVNSSGGNLVATIPASGSYEITCILITGTSAASWNAFSITGGAALSTGLIYVGVSGTPTPTQGLITVSGASGSASPVSGFIGENLTAVAGPISATTGAQATIVTLTLPVGIFSVSGTLNHDNNVGVTGSNYFLYIKGATSATLAKDSLEFRVVPAGNGSFCSRVVVVASGDADKTIILKAQNEGATGDVYGFISAIRIA